MRTLFGNSCAKGCLVYVLALLFLVVVSTVGIGGLKSKFGAGKSPTSSTEVTILTTGSQPVVSVRPEPKVAGNEQPGNGVSLTPEPPAQQPSASQQGGPAAAGDTTAAQAPVEAQGGIISGGATSPFYLVQPGDTLWSISQQFGTSVDALRTTNGLNDDIIKPGQVILLPPAAASGSAGGQSQAVQDASVPTMPQTGINKGP